MPSSPPGVACTEIAGDPERHAPLAELLAQVGVDREERAAVTGLVGPVEQQHRGRVGQGVDGGDQALGDGSPAGPVHREVDPDDHDAPPDVER